MFEAIKRNPVISGVAIFLVIVVNIVGWYLYFTWQNPLGNPLDLPTVTQPFSTATEVDLEEDKPSDTPNPEKHNSPTKTPEPTYTATIEPVCGGLPAMTVLVSGIDRNDYVYGLADAIRVVRVDFQTKKITVLSLPRELWVEIPGIEDDTGVSHGLLNMSYFYGTEGMGYAEGSGTGSSSLALTLQENFGLRVDHYIAVNMSSFRRIVDAVGGVSVCLDGDVYRGFTGPVVSKKKLFLKAGCHVLDGEEAEILVRQRLDVNPGTRLQYQTLVLKQLSKKVLSPSIFKSIPTLVDELLNSVQTDLSPSQISKFICLAEQIDPEEDIIFTTIPQDILRNRYTYFAPLDAKIKNFVERDEGAINEILSRFQNGEWPE